MEHPPTPVDATGSPAPDAYLDASLLTARIFRLAGSEVVRDLGRLPDDPGVAAAAGSCRNFLSLCDFLADGLRECVADAAALADAAPADGEHPDDAEPGGSGLSDPSAPSTLPSSPPSTLRTAQVTPLDRIGLVERLAEPA